MHLYVGTSNGFYKVPLNGKSDLSFVDGDFTPLSYTKGSSWCLVEYQWRTYYLGIMTVHMLYAEGKPVPLNSILGYYNFLPFYNVLPSKLVLAGNESGLDVLEWDNNRFVSKGNIPGFNEYSQFVAIDNNNTIWVGHPYRGVYKIELHTGQPASSQVVYGRTGACLLP